MLKSLPFLAPARVYIPWDPAIDTAAWRLTPDQYLSQIAAAETEPDHPPALPGQRVASITIAPLGYSAYAYALHMLRTHAGDAWYTDPAIQSHILRHAIIEVDLTDGDDAPRAVHEDGPYGRRLTAASWDRIGFFCDGQIWALLTLACMLRTSRVRGTDQG